MANPDFGYCVCPVCRYDRAAVRVAANGKAYISCEECVSNVRTLSSIGDRSIRAMMTSRAGGSLDEPAKPAAAPVAEAPAATAAPKKRGAFADAVDILTGGGR